MLNQLRFGRGLDNRRLKAAGFRYGHTSRETVLVLGEHLRLHPLLRSGAQEPYRYEREVEEFLRWSPHVRGSQTRNTPTLSSDAGERAPGAAGGPRRAGGRGRARARGRAAGARSRARAARAGARRPSRSPSPSRARPPEPPVDHYDDLAAEEVISLLGSLEHEDLLALRDYERGNAGRKPVVGAIESVLARRGSAARGVIRRHRLVRKHTCRDFSRPSYN